MSTKRRTTNPVTDTPCTVPIVIGADYLDTWGRHHHIYGHAKKGLWSDEINPEKVYSISNHFEIATGKGSSAQLVSLPPARELRYWKCRIEELKAVNSEDHLRLIAEGLDNMQKRVIALETRRKNEHC